MGLKVEFLLDDDKMDLLVRVASYLETTVEDAALRILNHWLEQWGLNEEEGGDAG